MDQPFAGFDANGTLGAATIGVIFSSILYGAAVVQTYTYYINFGDDYRWLKALVRFVIIFKRTHHNHQINLRLTGMPLLRLSDTAHMACFVHALYTLNVTNYGDPSAVLRPPNTVWVAAVFSSFIALSVQVSLYSHSHSHSDHPISDLIHLQPLSPPQGFFAYRIKRFSEKWTLAVLCLLLVIMRLIFSIIVTIKGFQMTSLIEFVRDSKASLTVMLTVSVCCDVFIAGSMCYYLTRQRNKFSKHTSKTIDKIVAWTIETGFANSVAGIVMLVLFIQFPHKRNYQNCCHLQ
ncbi:hypothetical protein CVT24_007884 [Panaeolus cyanescens]|uniref:DUF6534 domain-containing protein n=1 Tax=Panaeolus cyanescens TaxID=181874 RepID=A0A409WYX2_9AGAR|nr:hypothetical protein CVT24_007884 [Panaeolus cyanescens]